MARASRIAEEPAFVLHQHDWSEASLVLDVFSRHHGRVTLVAKGVKRPTSSFRPVLLPLQPLHLAWGGDGEVRTLKAARWLGGYTLPRGDDLMSGYYLNELVLRLLPRDDPMPELFDAFAETVHALAQRAVPASALLRAFELDALHQLGVLPDLTQQANGEPLVTTQSYRLLPEVGLCEPRHPTDEALSGAHWLALGQAYSGPPRWAACMALPPPSRHALRHQLRGVLEQQAGVGAFRTRQVWADVQALRPAPQSSGSPAAY